MAAVRKIAFCVSPPVLRNCYTPMMKNLDELRRALDGLTMLTAIQEYRDGLERLREEHAHEIQIVREPISRSSCFGFALGIVDMPRYQALAPLATVPGGLPLVNSSNLFDVLTGAGVEEITPMIAKSGNIVLYYAADKLTHAGVFISDTGRVRSQWGPCEVHEHGVLEAPASYGEPMRSFAGPTVEQRYRVMAFLEKRHQPKGK